MRAVGFTYLLSCSLSLIGAVACSGAQAPAEPLVRTLARPTTTPATNASAPPLEMAITVDDLPVHGPSFAGIDRVGIAKRMLTVFRAHHLPPVVGFVNGQKVDEHPETKQILTAWLKAGNPLGNHTYSHVGLNDTEVEPYLADLEKGETILKELVPDEKEWHFYRYPFLFEGPTMDKRQRVRDYLFAHHYSIAEVTIDGDDWAWNPPFARCMDKHDLEALRTLHEGYVKTHVDELRFIRRVTQEMLGRDIKHVLLLHIGAADAEAMDDLLTAFEKEGVRFVDLQTALADPIYQTDPASPSKAGASFVYPLAKSKGFKMGPLPSRPQEDALETTCR